MSTTTAAPAFTPEQFGELVDLAVKARSIAARSATGATITRDQVTYPKWVADPAVGWYGPLDDIAETDGQTDEVTVVPSKTAGLFRLSNELKDDSDPAIADLAGQGLANQIGRSVDAAYLGNNAAAAAGYNPKMPSGLLSIASTSVDTGTALTNLDPFLSARYAAEAHGSTLTSWIMSETVAESLSKLKVQEGSNQSLLQFVNDGITVAGLPVLVSDQVDAATVAWGIPRAHVRYVLRKGTTVEQFPNVQQDGIWIRAVTRIGFGFLNEPGVVRLHNAAA